MNSQPTDPSQPEQDATSPDHSPADATVANAAESPSSDPSQPTAEPTEKSGSGDPAGASSGAASATPPDVAPSSPRRKIQVGSRRGDTASDAAPPKPYRAQPARTSKPSKPKPPPRPEPVPRPSVRDPLTPDLEQEFEAAMNAASFDELMGDGPTSVGGGLESGARVTGKVIRLSGDDVFWSLGGPNEGVSSLRQFEQPPELGMELEVVVRGFNSEDGLHEVALPGAAIEADDWEDLEEGSVVEARITGANTGGLECKVNQMRGFIPASQVAMFRIEDYAEFIDQKLVCIVTEVNPRRKNLVLSRRAVLEREREEERKKLMESLEVGNTVEGTVRNLRDFGAFVDLGGVDGLIHISQLSWDRVEHPKEVLEVGQKVRVKIEKIDSQTGKIGLSYRDLLEHPWTNIDEKFPVDSEVTGTVSRIAQFGAFVKLAPGIEGLVHISELSHARVSTVGSVVSEGEAVNVKVLSVDRDAQRIALSMKAVLPVPEPEAESSDDASAEDVPPPELAVPKRDGPLKGGTGSKSGGEQFGLKW